MGRLKENLICLSLSLLVSAVIFELGCAAILKYSVKSHSAAIPDSQSSLHLFESSRGPLPFTVKPHFRQVYRTTEFSNQISTNNVGFRDPHDYHGEKVDLAFVGDSFTFGMGVESDETFTAQLRNRIPHLNVRSYSWPNGNHPINYYLYLKQNPELIPRTLGIALFLGNDLTTDPASQEITLGDDGLAQSATLRRTDPPVAGRIPFSFPGKRWLFTQLGRVPSFQLARVLYGRYVTDRYRKVPTDAEKPAHPASIDVALSHPAPKLVLRHLVAIQQLVREHGGDAFVVLIPEAWRLWSHPDCPYRESTCDEIRHSSHLQSGIQKKLRTHGITVFDATAILREKQNPNRPLYYPKDGHLTAAGHKVIAEFLRESLVIPPVDKAQFAANGGSL